MRIDLGFVTPDLGSVTHENKWWSDFYQSTMSPETSILNPTFDWFRGVGVSKPMFEAQKETQKKNRLLKEGMLRV